MSLWIKRDVLLPRNRKTYLLAELLAQGGGNLLGSRDDVAWRAIAIVLLEQLWAHVVEHYPAGDITDAPRAELADALSPWLSGTEWACRDVRELLEKSGHITRTRRGRMVVRDWLEWTGSDAMRLAKDRKRKRKARAARPQTRPASVHGRGAGIPALAEQSRAEQSRDQKLPLPGGGGPRADGASETWQLVRAHLQGAAREALDGYARSARHPEAFALAVLAESPDGIHGRAGLTWEVLGQALADMRAAGKDFAPVIFRAFCRKLLEIPPHPTPGDHTPAERMRAAAEKLEREGVA